MKHLPRRPRAPRAGFTLAEVAVTIVIVGIALVMVLQGLSLVKLEAAHTRNHKLARDLALLTLGQIEAGLYEEEVDGGRLFGTYADVDYPEFGFEVVFGDESFLEEDDYRYDPWRRDRYDDDEQQAEQAYEKVQIKIDYPPIQGFPKELILERWIPWKQVYGADEDAEPAGGAGGGGGGSGT